MTYQTVLQRLRFRLRDVRGVPTMYGSDGALFTLVNEAARELYRRTKDYEKSSEMSIVANQYDYDVSSEIATDVGEIYEILLQTGNKTLMPKNLRPFNKIVQNNSDSDDATENGNLTAETDFFRVWDGTLRFHPTPSTSDTATVYYFAQEPIIDYSNANLTLSLRMKDEYLESLLTYCKGLVYEIVGNEQMADKKKSDALAMIEEAKNSRTDYGFDTSVVVHGALD